MIERPMKDLISIRDFCAADVPRVLDYWYRSPAGYLESIGADPARLMPEEVMRSSMLGACAKNSELSAGDSKMPAVTLLYDDQPIGLHLVGPVVGGESAIFHAHIWDVAFRGKGISSVTYPLACEVFFRRFRLKKIFFRTPSMNIAAIRVKEKLGIRCTGEEPFESVLALPGLTAKCFELTPEELAGILGRGWEARVSVGGVL